MMACFRKTLVFVCLINLLMILCISFVTGNEVNDDDPLLPDLKFSTDITVSDEEGDEYTITFTVENVGEVDAKNITVNFKVVYDYDTDYEFTKYEENSTLVNINAGNKTTVDFIVPPLQLPSGYMIIMTIDPGDDIPESNENNNRLAQGLFYHPPPGPGRDDDQSGDTFFNYESLKTRIPIGILIRVICSLLIFFIFRWKKSKAKQ